MYVLVQHEIRDPQRFWSKAEQSIPTIPDGLKLHHSLAAKDGSRASCLWEADSVEMVRGYLEPLFGSFSTNRYAEAENRDGVAMPSGLSEAVGAKR